jgi:hypothetical protein
MKKNSLRFSWIVISALILMSCGSSDMIRPSQKIGQMWVNRYGHTNSEFIWDHCEDAMPDEPGSAAVECDIPWVDELFIGYGIRGLNTGQRDAIWDATTWELYIDDHPVDLPAFNIADFDGQDAGITYYYRLWRIRLRRIPEGVHTLRYIMHVDQELENVPDPRPVGTYELVVNFNFPKK